MRVVIALLFLAAVFACVFTSGSVVSAFQLFSAAGISDPGHLAVKFREVLYQQAIGSSLAAVALVLMAIHAFSQRAVIKGVMIALFTLLTGAIAAIAILDVGAVSNAPQSPLLSAMEPMYYQPASPLGRMSLQPGSPKGLNNILATANMRVLTCLCLLSLGASLTLIGGRVRPPPIAPQS